MKLQNLTVIFVIIIIPVILLLSLYISTGIKTIKYQAIYDSGLLTATHDAIYAFEQNTARDIYSDNPERKRDILKSSVKMFEKSLANTCNISSYNTYEIEEYIPAIVFGMYDGFYMYAPSGIYNSETRKTEEYKHNLKNYVYYSETLQKGSGWVTDATIIYSLDNYVTVSGDFGKGYEVRSGYLITDTSSDGKLYKGVTIKEEIINEQPNTDGIKYYKEGYKFTEWFNEKIGKKVKDSNNIKFLEINNDNDPENENSAFVQHKRQIIKNKIENVLNSTITAYSNRTWGNTYKMPKLSEEDWEKIYSNISMITFFQGKSIGLTKYNGYCVLNSTNSNEFPNSNLMYFIDENDEYHDIRCTEKKADGDLTGYKIGDFQRITTEEIDENGDTITKYDYKHKELACYNCVNGSLSSDQSIQSYIYDMSTTEKIKTAYWTSLGRERYRNIQKVSSGDINKATVGIVVTENSTIDGEEYSSTNPVIPAGFKAINTDTSRWNAEAGPEVDKGLVIQDEVGNEFVWVPVAELNAFARLQEGSTENYRGVLYDWTKSGYPEYEWSANGTSYKEPDGVETYDGSCLDEMGVTKDLNKDGKVDETDAKEQLQNEFNSMAKSVAKYKGFYVGRYEMSLSADETTAQSKELTISSDANDSTTNMWYGLYSKAKTYTSSYVQSSMMWGCQYDAMIHWMGNDAHTLGGEKRNLTTETGSVETDKLKNVYDLYGNRLEWTLEWTIYDTREDPETFCRVRRGGSYGHDRYLSKRMPDSQKSQTGYTGSRLSLYIK